MVLQHCFSQYDRPEIFEGEVIPDDGKVQSGMGQSMEKLVKKFEESGLRLRAFREAEFEAEQQIPDDYVGMGPLNFLDALQMRKEVEKRLYAQKAEAIAKKRAEKAAAEAAVAARNDPPPEREVGEGGPPPAPPREGE